MRGEAGVFGEVPEHMPQRHHPLSEPAPDTSAEGDLWSKPAGMTEENQHRASEMMTGDGSMDEESSSSDEDDECAECEKGVNARSDDDEDSCDEHEEVLQGALAQHIKVKAALTIQRHCAIPPASYLD